MYENENLHSSSMTLIMRRNHQLTFIAVRPAPKITIYENIVLYKMYQQRSIFNAILCYHIKAVTSCSTYKIDQQETDGSSSKIQQSRFQNKIVLSHQIYPNLHNRS